jgi:hypothetical protein
MISDCGAAVHPQTPHSPSQLCMRRVGLALQLRRYDRLRRPDRTLSACEFCCTIKRVLPFVHFRTEQASLGVTFPAGHCLSVNPDITQHFTVRSIQHIRCAVLIYSASNMVRVDAHALASGVALLEPNGAFIPSRPHLRHTVHRTC